MRVFVRQNLSSMVVAPCDNIQTLEPVQWPTFKSKSDRNAFWAQPTTKGVFYSGYEGVSGSAKCGTEDNPILKMWTLVVDYDSAAPADIQDYIEGLRKAPYAPYRPAWLSITNTGNLRLLWNLECPITIASPQQLKAFLISITRHLAIIKWHGGFDAPALNAAGRYFEFGKAWYPVCENDVIPRSALLSWLWSASKTVDVLKRNERVEVPLELAYKQLAHKYGENFWDGPFEVGAQGRRFWDPSADNETAVWLRPDGFVCFTGDVPFMPWRKSELLGDTFVDQLQGDRLSKVYDHVVFDDQSFWVDLGGSTGWEKYSAAQFREWLAVQGFNPKVEKGATASEVSQISQHVLAHCRVRGVLPFLYHPHGVIKYRKEKILNISRIRALTPAEPGCYTSAVDAKTRCFPWIWSYLSQLLCTVNGAPVQLRYLLAWMKHAYTAALTMDPTPGHAIVMAGPTGRGKSFFSSHLMAELLGGSVDAADNLIKGSQWTDKLAKWPIAVIDDQQGGNNFDTHTQFSALVKKLVANQSMNYNGKWMQTGEVEWNGRVIISCNDDAESIKLIPNMDMSIRDKISLLKVAKSNFVFPDKRQKTRAIVEAELPAFARFLLDIPYPPEMINPDDTRYFLKPFCHPELFAHASRGTRMYVIFELLAKFLDWWSIQNGGKDVWEGTATQLHESMQICYQGSDQFRKIDNRMLGTALGELRGRGCGIEVSDAGKRGVRWWKIPMTLNWSTRSEYDTSKEGDGNGRDETGAATDDAGSHDWGGA